MKKLTNKRKSWEKQILQLPARYDIRNTNLIDGICGFGVNLVEIASSTFEGSATGAAVELIIEN